MNSEITHQYIMAFVPLILVGIVFITKMDENTDRIATAVDDLTEVVEGNTKRGLQNSQNIAVLDNRVGYLEGKK